MAAKKTSKKKPTLNKSAFVRSLPAAMSGAEVVAKAKAAGIKISLAYVYGIRAKSNAMKRGGIEPKRRSSRRPTPAPKSRANGVAAHGGASALGGLVTEIERIVEAKVAELLKARLGAILN